MIVVMYHYIRSGTEGRALHALHPDAFRRQLEYFIANGGVVDARALVDCANDTEPPPGRFVLTFDDGLREHGETVADILDILDLSAFYFPSSLPLEQPILLRPHRLHILLAALDAACLLDEVEGLITPAMYDEGSLRRFSDGLYANQHNAGAATRLKVLFNYQLDYSYADDILAYLFSRHAGNESDWVKRWYAPTSALRRLTERHVVGNHSASHPLLARLDRAAQTREIVSAQQCIGTITGSQPTVFCFPYGIAGSYDNDTLDILRDHDYRLGFCFDNAGIEWNNRRPLELGRIDCNRYL